MRRLRVTEKGDLAAFLTARGYTRTKAKSLVRHRAVAVNGTTALRHDHPVEIGDSVTVAAKTDDLRAPGVLREALPGAGHEAVRAAYLPPGIEIVFEDDSLLVLTKPSGLLTIATEHEKRRTVYYMINGYLKKRKPGAKERVFIVHRLDRETSGLIVFAKSEAVKELLQKAWKKTEKRYYAVVEGVPREKEGLLKSHLSETSTFRVYSGGPSKGSKLAVTRYRVVGKGPKHALLDVSIETGRKHQIRVHLSDIDHPVAGDKKYGAESDPLGRLALHAYLLAFPHPVTGTALRLETPLPEEFSKLVRREKSPPAPRGKEAPPRERRGKGRSGSVKKVEHRHHHDEKKHSHS